MDAGTRPVSTGRDRQRQRTRGKLVAGARRLIAENGVASLRISEITQEADVALGSFYNHFETKEELVEAVIAESLEELASAVVDRSAEAADPAHVVSEAIRRFVRLAYDDPDFARLVVHLSHAGERYESATERAAREALARGIESGRFDVPDPEVTRMVITFGSLAVMKAIVDGEYEGSDADDRMAELALRQIGLSPDEAASVARLPLPELPS